MSAATRVELGIVIEARTGSAGTQLLEELLGRVAIEVVSVDVELAEEAIVAWRRFGKGRPQAGETAGHGRSEGAGSPHFRLQVDNWVDNGVVLSRVMMGMLAPVGVFQLGYILSGLEHQGLVGRREASLHRSGSDSHWRDFCSK